MTNRFANKSFAPSTQSSNGGGEGGVNVDWDALNKYIAETVQEATGCEEGSPASVCGFISGLVDLGKHQDEERIEPFEQAGDVKGNEWRQKMVDKGKASVDAEGMFHYQAPERQEVAFYVDFPFDVDKGQFFGDSNPAPYRVLMGGVFMGQPAQPTKVEGYPNKDNKWVFGDKNRATTLAKAAGLKNLKDGFEQDRLLELIGKPMQFSVEVFVNEKGYLQEKVTKPTRLMAGIPIPDYNEDLLFYVGMNDEENDETSLKYLTKAVKTYIQSASDYEGSVLQKQMEALQTPQSDSKPSESKDEQSIKGEIKTPEKTAKETEIPEEEEFPFDSDIPF